MKLSGTFKYTSILFLLLLMIFFVLFWWSLGTTTGTKKIFTATQSRLHNVSYEYESGDILNGLALSKAEWRLKNGVVVSAKKLKLKSDAKCWHRKKLCIDEGTAKQLIIKLPLNKNSSNEIVLKELSLLLALETKGISVDELIITHPTRAPVIFTDAEISGQINESEIALSNFKSKWNQINLQGSGTITMQDNYPIDIRGTASHAVTDNALQATWTAEGDFKTANLSVMLSKPFAAQLGGVVSLLDKRLPLDMDFQWRELGIPFTSDAPAVELNNGTINITGTWPDYTAKGVALTNGAALPSGKATLDGVLSVKQLRLEPLVIETLDGIINARGRFSWTNGVHWSAAYTAVNLNPGFHWQQTNGRINGTGEFTGTFNQEVRQLNFKDISASGRLNDFPIMATGDISKDHRGWNLNNVQLNSRDNNASANGIIGDAVKLVFSLKSAEQYLPGARGDINGDVTMSGDIKSPTAEGSITTSNIEYKNIRLDNARIHGKIVNLAKDYSNLQFQAQSLEIDDRTIEHINLSVHGSLEDHLLQVKLHSHPLHSVALEVTGSADEYFNWNGIVNSASSRIKKRRLSLVNTFTATWINDNRTLAVQPHCWKYDFASVCVEKSALIGETGVVQFALNRLPLESIEQFTPDNVVLRGNLQSRGNLSWGPGEMPSVKVDSYLEGASAMLNKMINKNKLHLDIPVAKLNITTSGNIVKSKLRMETDKFATVTADLEIDTARKSLPVKGSVNLSRSPLNWIKNYLPDINLLNGRIEGDARISGTLQDPLVNSEIRVREGRVQSALLPVEVKQINIGLNIDGKHANIKGTALANDTGITIEGQGAMTDQGLSSDLTLIGKGIKLQHEYAEQAVLSPRLTFKIRPNNIGITGNIKVPTAKITLKSLTTDGIPISDDVVITDDSNATNGSVTAIGSTGINTLVNIVLGDDVSVSGYGLKADLNGDFQFSLASRKPPSFSGAVEVSNGNYRAYGQRLKVRDGRITFTGPLEQTALSVEAVRELRDLNAGVRIKGTLKNPITTLFSEPSLPEEEILPYLVLGRRLELDESDDTGVLNKAALLLGVNTGQRISSRLAKTLGIDELSLSAWGSGEETQILVSGKLTEKLLLRYGVGVFKNSNSLFLRYNLADQLYLETTQGLESAVDLFYSFDF